MLDTDRPEEAKNIAEIFGNNEKHQMILHPGLLHHIALPHSQPRKCQRLIATRSLLHLAT